MGLWIFSITLFQTIFLLNFYLKSTSDAEIYSLDELPSYASLDERIVELHGEAAKVLKATEEVLGHLRKLLVDHSVVAMYEKNLISQDRALDAWADRNQFLALHAPPKTSTGPDHSLSLKPDHYFDQEIRLDSKISHSGLSLYAQEPGLGGYCSVGHARAAAPIFIQVTQTMQVLLSYIIEIGGANIAFIHRTGGAFLSVQESDGHPDEITVEIKGTSYEVQTVQQLIQVRDSGEKHHDTVV
ncbi:hypothetical protein Nepgr_012587 [Nepenthes gracilis]|uniref:Uncharacterized protein n=1 Tax=Nepenthes gracilis TaxID=150966 RepID=A0AAD3SH88_NEPGR|nr:hypothetical protein Nepgr_012587 [Nepenthes gracilis]